ncbi:RCC1/BLIP-II [Umbelopsis sp. PMI_123]|nr:RCC1/BLIP-II [Umbelopsis sp. PMI_123]
MATDQNKAAPTWGKLLICGTTAWDVINRKNKATEETESQILLTPHLVRDLVDIKVVKAVTGPTACHSVIISERGHAWVFGRNERGQIGTKSKNCQDYPIKVTSIAENRQALGDRKIIGAATGRNHTLLLCDSGEVFAAGDNRLGQLGLTDLNDHITFKLVTSLVGKKIVQVACGAEFSLVLTDKGQIFAFGSQEYGQLGNGSDGQYIKTAGKMSTSPQPYPLAVRGLQNQEITEIACGANHSLAKDKDGHVYSWGFGGYGRLGHGEQKDAMIPQSISFFAGSNELSRCHTITCGATCSMALDNQKQVLLWGKWKNTGDGSAGQPWMQPRYIYDLNGWRMKDISAGSQSLLAIAEEEPTTIAWGQVQSSELGFGEESTVKSATRPQKLEPLEGIPLLSVSGGMGHTMFIATPGEEKLQDLPKWPVTPEFEGGCVKCGKGDNEEQILLCDKCDNPMHTYCAVPPLKDIPEGDWYCDSCHPNGHSADSEDESSKVSKRSHEGSSSKAKKQKRG